TGDAEARRSARAQSGARFHPDMAAFVLRRHAASSEDSCETGVSDRARTAATRTARRQRSRPMVCWWTRLLETCRPRVLSAVCAAGESAGYPAQRDPDRTVRERSAPRFVRRARA